MPTEGRRAVTILWVDAGRSAEFSRYPRGPFPEIACGFAVRLARPELVAWLKLPERPLVSLEGP
jgi:hypothetical protein